MITTEVLLLDQVALMANVYEDVIILSYLRSSNLANRSFLTMKAYRLTWCQNKFIG